MGKYSKLSNKQLANARRQSGAKLPKKAVRRHYAEDNENRGDAVKQVVSENNRASREVDQVVSENNKKYLMKRKKKRKLSKASSKGKGNS